jgi:hypothetical protein
VECQLIRTQFKHIAQDDYLTSLCHHQQINGRLHGYRVGIIAVVDDRFVCQLQDITTTSCGLYGSDALQDIPKVNLAISKFALCMNLL